MLGSFSCLRTQRSSKNSPFGPRCGSCLGRKTLVLFGPWLWRLNLHITEAGAVDMKRDPCDPLFPSNEQLPPSLTHTHVISRPHIGISMIATALNIDADGNTSQGECIGNGDCAYARTSYHINSIGCSIDEGSTGRFPMTITSAHIGGSKKHCFFRGRLGGPTDGNNSQQNN